MSPQTAGENKLFSCIAKSINATTMQFRGNVLGGDTFYHIAAQDIVEAALLARKAALIAQ